VFKVCREFTSELLEHSCSVKGRDIEMIGNLEKFCNSNCNCASLP
jgi:hypothetical protein